MITDWKEFKNPDFDAIKARLKQPGSLGLQTDN